MNNDIVWDKKIYKSGVIVESYEDIDTMFTDSTETQNQIRKANDYSVKSSLFLWGGTAAALTYLFSTIDSDMGVYWGIFAAGLSTSLYYNYKRNQIIDDSIENYNKKKGFSFNPIIDTNKNLGAKASYLISF